MSQCAVQVFEDQIADGVRMNNVKLTTCVIG